MTKSIAKTDAPTAALTRLGVDFADHQDFESTVGRAVLGGGVGALVAHGLSSALGVAVSLPLLSVLLTAGALTLVGGKKKSWLGAAFGAVVGTAGGLLHQQYAAQWPWFGALLLGGAAAPLLAKGESLGKMAVTGLFTGVMAYAGMFVVSVLHSRGFLEGLMPAPMATMMIGCAGALFVGLGAAPKHIRTADDPVESAYDRAVTSAKGELKEILERSLGIYRTIRDDSVQHRHRPAQLTSQVSDMSMRILHIADRCGTIENDLFAANASELEDRILALTSKAEEAKDAGAKQTLHCAIESLESQREALESIGRGRERVVARLHANVALLEKVRFSLVHLKSADAERAGSESTPLNDAIEELSRELEATSQAVGEVYGERPSLLETDVGTTEA